MQNRSENFALMIEYLSSLYKIKEEDIKKGFYNPILEKIIHEEEARIIIFEPTFDLDSIKPSLLLEFDKSSRIIDG